MNDLWGGLPAGLHLAVLPAYSTRCTVNKEDFHSGCWATIGAIPVSVWAPDTVTSNSFRWFFPQAVSSHTCWWGQGLGRRSLSASCYLSVVPGGSHNTHFICFLVLRETLPNIHCLEIYSFVYFVHSLIVSRIGVKSVTVTPSCSEVKVTIQLILTRLVINSKHSVSYKTKLSKISSWIIDLECMACEKSVLFIDYFFNIRLALNSLQRSTKMSHFGKHFRNTFCKNQMC